MTMAKICQSITPENSIENIITQLPPKEMESSTQVSIVLKLIIISNYKVKAPSPQGGMCTNNFSSISSDHLKSILKT